MTPEIPYWFCNEDEVVDSDLNNQESGELTLNPEVTLFKLKSGDFQVSQMGNFKAILSGADYILIRRDIAQFLGELFPNDVGVKNVEIIRKASNEKWNNYSHISIKKNIEFKGYHERKVEGLHIYKMFDSLIYISADVKKQLIKHFPDLSGMVFKQGLPIVAG